MSKVELTVAGEKICFEVAQMIKPKAHGTGTSFWHINENGNIETVTVSEGYAAVKTLMDAVSIGVRAKKIAVLLFDATAGKLIGTHHLVDFATGQAFQLPINTIITRSWYRVINTFTTANDSGTISLGIATDDVAGLKAALAISNGANIWDAGLHEGIQDGTVANAAEITIAARSVDAVVAVQDLTAGKLALVLEYVEF